MCFKYGGSHNSKESQESIETPAKRALCGANHPASYRGCEPHNNIIKGNKTLRNNTQHTLAVNTNIYIYIYIQGVLRL